MTIGARLYVAVLILLAIGCSVPATNRFVDPRLNPLGNAPTGDPGCEASTLVSTGGSFPKEPKTLAIRWTGIPISNLLITARSYCSTPISIVVACSHRSVLKQRM
jgi:hypothetical protein